LLATPAVVAFGELQAGRAYRAAVTVTNAGSGAARFRVRPEVGGSHTEGGQVSMRQTAEVSPLAPGMGCTLIVQVRLLLAAARFALLLLLLLLTRCCLALPCCRPFRNPRPQVKAKEAGALSSTLTLDASDYGSAESLAIGVTATVVAAGAPYQSDRTARGVDVVLETGQVVNVRDGGLDSFFPTEGGY
jgi:hypothetical protein